MNVGTLTSFLVLDRSDYSSGIDASIKQANQMSGELTKMENVSKSASDTFVILGTVVKSLAAAFATLKLTEAIKDSALMAARYETLGAVMTVVGNNAGYTSQQMDGFEKSLRSTGIAMIESRTVLTRMAQAHLDLANSSKLARVAQDAAVIGNINSSEAFERMVNGIKAGEVEILRNIGLNVNFEQSYRDLEKELGKHKNTLTETEKIQARMNSVMEAGTSIAGTYEASMGTAGKQLLSIQRYLDDAKTKFGATFNDLLIISVRTFTDILKETNQELDSLTKERKIKEWSENLASAVGAIVTPVQRLAQALQLISALSDYFAKNKSLDPIGSPDRQSEAAKNLQKTIDELRNKPTFSETVEKTFKEREENSKLDEALKRVTESVRIKKAATLEAANADKLAKEAAEEATKKYIKQNEALVNSLLPMKEYEDDLKTLNELHKLGAITVDQHTEASEALYRNTPKFKQAVSEAKDELKLIVDEYKKWNDEQKRIDELMTSTLPEEERQLEAIRQTYIATTQAVWDLYDAKRIDEDEAERRNAAAEKERDIAIKHLEEVKKAHEKTTTEIDKLWEHASERMTDTLADWLVTNEFRLESFGDSFKRMVAQMIATWVMAQAKMVFTGQTDIKGLSQMGGVAGLFSSVASGSNSSLGAVSGIIAGANEFLNPGAFAGSLLNTKLAVAEALKSLGFESAAKGVVGLSQTQFGAGLSGLGTFAIDLLSGKEFKQSAAEGIASGLGYTLGSMTPLGPIGGMIGSFLATTLAGSFFGGQEDYVLSSTGYIPSYDPSKKGVAPGSYWEGTVAAMTETSAKVLASLPKDIADAAALRLKDSYISLDFIKASPDSNALYSELQATITARYTETLKTTLLAAADSMYVTGEQVINGLRYPVEKSTAVALLTADAQKKLNDSLTVLKSADVDTVVAGINSIATTLNQISNLQNSLSETAKLRGMTEIERQAYSINKEFDNLSTTLSSLGIDITKVTELELNRKNALSDLSKEMRTQFELESKRYGQYGAIPTSMASKDIFDEETSRRVEAYKAYMSGTMTQEEFINLTNQIVSISTGKGRELIDQYIDPITKLADSLGNTEFQKGLNEILDWQRESINNAQGLYKFTDQQTMWSWIDDINLVAKDKTQKLIDSFITPILDEWRGFFYDIQMSDLAPVQSAEMFTARFDELLEATKSGDGSSVSELLNYTKTEFLPFMREYAPNNYQNLWGQLFGEGGKLSNLEINLGGPSIEKLGTWMGQELKSVLAPILSTNQNGDLQVTLNLDEYQLGLAMAKIGSTNKDFRTSIGLS